MLKNVLGAYLDNIKEREFDLPFTTLLHAAGFSDVHFTHGSAEFGKDFIGKLLSNGATTQYSFQLKAGDVSQPDWRNDIMGQMLESVISGLSHPSFDKNLLHQTVLVVTGRLKGNAALSLQDLNTQIQGKYGKLPIILWDREDLTSKLETYSLGGVYQATASGYIRYGNFYQLYGKALEHHISQREIEKHSRQWLDNSIEPYKRLVCSAIESSVFASQCQRKGMLYESICAQLTVTRTLMHMIYTLDNKNENQQLLEVYQLAIAKLGEECRRYFDDVRDLWIKANNNLSSRISGACSMMVYLIHCARIIELAGCLFFLEDARGQRDEIISFIDSFILKEPGCAHIPGDYYAVSLVLPVLALCSAGKRETASQLLRNATIWLCDRYRDGCGLASFSSEQYEEIVTLLGHPFEFFKIRPRSGSFTASVISDLAAFVADKGLYSDIVNDIKATHIIPQYWQIPDTQSLFCIDGRDIIAYPKIDYCDELVPFDTYAFADHVQQESRTFGISNHVGPFGLMFMMLLMRDRYFPTLWPLLGH